MAVPKQRHTKSRRNKRRMHLFLEKPNLSLCPKCGKGVLPHAICWNCGYYKGEEVIDVLKKLGKKEKKQREKEMKAKEKEERETGKEKPVTWEELSKK
ncbi:MAG: 50S ribosomal protein L32 [Candidatus Nealsonbacteria bacterium RBG_13_36_15]|uniref:Large ribosomal subunit protein bL32 n=1 Tax=Candidatus Nealsonbacteria bacterium RBG_13_36_15 TaxID=1801660 RepID=A0A1G2DWU1_9BACT|nr:MAG: 50S ribosomal protein L32 [Candidatus Nealsonbacteria bacterium RBG_13_36_15]